MFKLASLLTICAGWLVGQTSAFGTLCPPSDFYMKGNIHNSEPMPENFKVAFFGDEGIQDSSRTVLRQLLSDGAQMILVLGDFDYRSSPKAWIEMLDEELGPDFPVFASIGNHDFLRWDAYAEELTNRYERTNVTQFCEGEIGVKMTCHYKGLYIINSGVGVSGADHDVYIDAQLAAGESIWKVCGWHKNHRKYQTGDKPTAVPARFYDLCRKHGAIVATGHEHSYARTHLMSNFEEFEIASTSNTLDLSLNHSFCFVSGLGGESVRNWDNGFEENEWWAATASSDNGVTDGPLICTFNVGGDIRAAECYFRDTNGNSYDSFRIYSHLDASESAALGMPCSSNLKEYPVSSPEHDIQTGATDRTVLTVSPRFGKIYLTFENILSDVGAAAFDEARLQVYGVEDGHYPRMRLRGRLSDGRPTRASVLWDTEDDNFEGVAVWESPDLSEIIREVLAEEGATDLLTLEVFGLSGEAKFYSIDFGPCFAPTMVVVYPKEC